MNRVFSIPLAASTTVFCALLWSGVAKATDRIAFVVGNGDYDEVASLRNPRNDANDIGERLKTLGFSLHADRVHHNLNKRQLQRQYISFTEAAEGAEIALLYFAGHGMQFDRDPHILPVDIPDDYLTIVKKDAISLNEMLDDLSGRAELTVAIFDACREIPNYNQRIGQKARGGNDSAWRGLSRPTVKIDSTLIAFSGGSGELVADGKGRNSPYTALLLEHLEPAQLQSTSMDIPALFAEVSFQFRIKHTGQRPEVINQGVRPDHYYFSTQTSTATNTEQLRPIVPGSNQAFVLNYERMELNLDFKREERRQVQLALSEQGMNVGIADGFWGESTRQGITRFNSEQGFPGGEYLSARGYKRLMQMERERRARVEEAAAKQLQELQAAAAVLAEQRKRQAKVRQLVRQIELNLVSLKLTTPPNDNANDQLTELDSLDPNNSFVEEGRAQIFERYVGWIESQISRNDLPKAVVYLESLSLVPGSENEVDRLRMQISDMNDQEADDQRRQQEAAAQALVESQKIQQKRKQEEAAQALAESQEKQQNAVRLDKRNAEAVVVAQREEKALSISRSWRRGIQIALNEAGLDVGTADGVWGAQTRTGIRLWQKMNDLQVTGYLTIKEFRKIVDELDVQKVQPEQRTTEKESDPAISSKSSTNLAVPEMVTLKGGKHNMGNVAAYKVTIGPFEIGKFEVTVSQFREFTNATGYQTDASRNTGKVKGCNIWIGDEKAWKWTSGLGVGFVQQANHPISCVSWADAQAYVNWLNTITAGGFRIPSEAEWEFAASAGRTSDWSFRGGKSELCVYGNGADRSTSSEFFWSNSCDDGYKRTSPVGAFKPNGHQVYDVHGNVSEWVEDCWHSKFKGVPKNGVAWTNGCAQNRRVIRGGAWYHSDNLLQTRHRYWFDKNYRDSTTGFRIARSIRN